MRPNETQRDLADAAYKAVSCGNTSSKGAVHDGQFPTLAGPRRRGRRPLSCPDLAHNWPTGTVNGPGTAPGHTSGPVRGPGLTWAFAWQVLGSNQRRRMPAILQTPRDTAVTCANVKASRHLGTQWT